MSSGFSNIEISCFRGIDHLNIDGLARVNVFVGANNVGKTSILEAAFMLVGMSNPLMPTRVNYWRAVTAGTVDGARYLFHNLDFNARPLLEAGTEAGVRWLTFEPVLANEAGAASSAAYNHSTIKRLDFHFGIKGGEEFSGSSSLFLDKDGNMQQTTASGYVENMNCLYLSADKNDGNASTNFATLVKRNGKQQVVDALRGFDKSIETIEALPDGLYLKVKGVRELLPVCMAGDGVRRMVNIVSSIANEDYNMLLIDEFDNGLHYTAHKKLWKAVLRFVAGRNVQLFTTTHNLDCLQGLVAAMDEDEALRPLVNVYDIAQTEVKGLQAYGYSYYGLKEAIDKELEIRQ